MLYFVLTKYNQLQFSSSNLFDFFWLCNWSLSVNIRRSSHPSSKDKAEIHRWKGTMVPPAAPHTAKKVFHPNKLSGRKAKETRECSRSTEANYLFKSLALAAYDFAFHFSFQSIFPILSFSQAFKYISLCLIRSSIRIVEKLLSLRNVVQRRLWGCNEHWQISHTHANTLATDVCFNTIQP